LYQVQGKTLFEMKVVSDCHYNCTTEPLMTNVNHREIG